MQEATVQSIRARTTQKILQMYESALLGWDHRALCTTEMSRGARRACLSRPPSSGHIALPGGVLRAHNRHFQRMGRSAGFFEPQCANIAVQAFGRRLQSQCAQNKPSPCAQNNQHVAGHLGVRADELTEQALGTHRPQAWNVLRDFGQITVTALTPEGVDIILLIL